MKDESRPDWHVYVFVPDGVEYVQVNGLYGVVHTAVGTANGTAVVLPVGVDSQNVSISQSSTVGTTDYSDRLIVVSAIPQANGGTAWFAQPATRSATLPVQATTSTSLAAPTARDEDCGSCRGGGRGG